jgi:glutamate---cysteine ligase / carboxylate-amine ligase
VEHTIGIAALYRCLVRHLVNNTALNRDIGAAERAITLENKWIAQRHGIHGGFIDAATKTVRPVIEMVEDMIAMLESDAAALNCREELLGLRNILTYGTSADQQIALETDSRGRGKTGDEALSDIIDWLALATRGLEGPSAMTVH